MTNIHAVIRDTNTGQILEAKVHIQNSGGEPVLPSNLVQKVGPGLLGFYADGHFDVTLPLGLCHIIVERGTEYIPWERSFQIYFGASLDLEINLERWICLPEQGWYPGNTHIHYDHLHANSNERLRLDLKVHDLHVTVVSLLQRTDFAYASNVYPIGVMNEISSAHHVVDIGEECRHNRGDFEIGYGHVMFIHLRAAVQPVSRGLLVHENDPDYPPLCYACDEAHRQGAIVIWCHNGVGMEAPVAAALGKLDAMNLFDPYQWLTPEYDIWYKLLNCGFKLAASTGSDWFICSNNRVYARAGEIFTYEGWLDALKKGHTFITNGPALFLKVDELGPGSTLTQPAQKPAAVEVSWDSYLPITSIELVFNGKVISHHSVRGTGNRKGCWETRFSPPNDGWLAARAAGTTRDSFFQPMFAHTSPVWITTGHPAPEAAESAAYFLDSLKDSQEWIRAKAKFTSTTQLNEISELFKQARNIYKEITAR